MYHWLCPKNGQELSLGRNARSFPMCASSFSYLVINNNNNNCLVPYMPAYIWFLTIIAGI